MRSGGATGASADPLPCVFCSRARLFFLHYFLFFIIIIFGNVNACAQVVPLQQLEGETMRWCRRIMQNSPTAIACLKAALNADEDGQAGTMQVC
jgi:hypothetical protein